MASFQFIDRAAALAEMGDLLQSAPELALDTEFMRERSYYPRLCLVQLAAPQGIFCIDPLAIEDLTPLTTLLTRAASCKVLHAARQDVEVLLTRCEGVPTNMFDTQVAAALLGMPPQIGYGDLVQRLLGVSLEKGHARTDWSVRPLSAPQLEYAADDVHHLPPLRTVLQRELERLGRTQWFEAEMLRQSDPALYRTEPAAAWQRLKGSETLDERRLAVLKALAQWREQRAMRRDLPRGWILADDALREIVQALPQTAEELARLDSVPRGVVEKCAGQILTAVQQTAHLTTGSASQRRPRPDAQQQARLKALSATVQEIAASLKLSPEVLATRRDLMQLLNGQMDVEPLKGWRRAVVGEALLAKL